MIVRCDASWSWFYVNEREKLDAEWQEPEASKCTPTPLRSATSVSRRELARHV